MNSLRQATKRISFHVERQPYGTTVARPFPIHRHGGGRLPIPQHFHGGIGAWARLCVGPAKGIHVNRPGRKTYAGFAKNMDVPGETARDFDDEHLLGTPEGGHNKKQRGKRDRRARLSKTQHGLILRHVAFPRFADIQEPPQTGLIFPRSAPCLIPGAVSHGLPHLERMHVVGCLDAVLKACGFDP